MVVCSWDLSRARAHAHVDERLPTRPVYVLELDSHLVGVNETVKRRTLDPRATARRPEQAPRWKSVWGHHMVRRRRADLEEQTEVPLTRW